jgi:hypothetical protein
MIFKQGGQSVAARCHGVSMARCMLIWRARELSESQEGEYLMSRYSLRKSSARYTDQAHLSAILNEAKFAIDSTQAVA